MKLYLARDWDDDLFLYTNVPPTRLEGHKEWTSDDLAPNWLMPPQLFPELQWKDEPIEVSLNRENK